MAAWKGHLHVLKWAHMSGCPWDQQTTAHSAWGGHLDCLQYARYFCGKLCLMEMCVINNMRKLIMIQGTWMPMDREHLHCC